MIQTVAQLCGGVGLFLLGMSLITDSLKDLAGTTLKNWLSKFTATPLKAMFSGIGLTLLLNSSTATTVATIGFVSAGAIGFSHAIGVIIGANIGTTSTGWLVALLGLKFSISLLALPLIGVGAILHLIAKDRSALGGLAIAGFGLLFYGIDVLQEAMSIFSEHADLSFFAYHSLWSKLLLVLIGIVTAMILQSSSATVTATLAALATGAIDLPQAIYMVIGQNVGAVSITILSALGASISAKRTVMVNVIFNLVSAVLAFIFLAPCFIVLHQHVAFFAQWDAVLILAAFHSGFSLLGACVLMPLVKPLERLIIRLLPEQAVSILACLDETGLKVPAVAVQSAEKVLLTTLYEILSILLQALKNGNLPSKAQLTTLDNTIQHLESYLEKITVPTHPELKQQFLDILRIMVYVRVFRSDLENINNASLVRSEPAIYQLALDFTNIFDSYLHEFQQLTQSKIMSNLRSELNNLKKWSSSHREEIRNKVIEYSSENQLSAANSLELLAAHRWIDRLIAHSYRFTNVVHDTLVAKEKQPSVD